MLAQISKIKTFRQTLYSFFNKRKDAIMNLIDAITSHGHQCNSVVQLSNADFFKRQYSSITDAIADGLPHADWEGIRKVVYQSVTNNEQNKPNRFLIDCTPNPRPFANKLADRTITHAPNPAPGNKPICVGHQYSVLALLPDDEQARKKHWLVPLDVQRVQSHEKGNEVSMRQLVNCINELGLQDGLNISISDSLHGTENCRILASQQENLIHIFRVNSKRNFYFAPTEHADDTNKVGRKKEFGKKMILHDESTHQDPHQQLEIPWQSRSGKQYKVLITCWKDMLLRGSRAFRSSKYPINLIRATVVDEQDKPVFKRSLWIGVFGKQRHQITPIDVFLNYIERYDIEHLFRFNKAKLLLDRYQTSEVEHEVLWWQLCLLAYAQLYLARTLVPVLPQPWERYLPAYKDKHPIITTPAQTQRGFSTVLKKIGTPAAPCVTRGSSPGRIPGETIKKRERQNIIFKSNKTTTKDTETILSGSELASDSSNPGKIQALLETVKATLMKINFSPPQFAQMLIDTS